MDDSIAFTSRPLYVMAKPAGAHCNLRCGYCYYLEKEKLYADGGRHVMSDELLERFVRDYIESQTWLDVLFTWHGGEPLMRPLAFYQKAIDLQRRYANGHNISNCIQTNATMLNDEWCRFFADNGWLVGVSIDGPRDVHDAYRKKADGGSSFDDVVRGIELLDKYRVEWNAMAVVNDINVKRPLEFYRFFRDNGCRYLQFTPVVERVVEDGGEVRLAHVGDVHGSLASYSVKPMEWGRFLVDVFDEWVRHDVGKMYVEIFDCTLANWCGMSPGICVYGKVCGHAGVMEHNGDVYSCDHFVFPQYKLGNIGETSLMKMLYGERQEAFSKMKQEALPQCCRECRYLFACNGECPKNRFVSTPQGEKGLNYLCQGYYMFYDHVAPYMNFMKNEYVNQRPPANIMAALKQMGW